jgi:hypothetical protein
VVECVAIIAAAATAWDASEVKDAYGSARGSSSSTSTDEELDDEAEQTEVDVVDETACDGERERQVGCASGRAAMIG